MRTVRLVRTVRTVRSVRTFCKNPLFAVRGSRRVSCNDAFKDNNSPFSTSRDSKAVSLRWRESVTIQDALKIQKMCNDEMLQLGYLPITDKLNGETDVIQPLHLFEQ